MTGQMNTVSISDFKARCLAMIEEVNRTGVKLTILKRGKVVAVVEPPPRPVYPQHSLAGTVRIHGDIIESGLPEQDWECLK